MIKTYNQQLVFLMVFLLFGSVLYAQDRYQRNVAADVLAYDFHLGLNDSTDHIVGRADITIDVKDEAIPFALDLIGKNGPFGMQLTGVQENGADIPYTFVGNKIGIAPTTGKSTIHTYTISYNGMPERGLVIDSTKFGERSFFGDNWPNLARHWLPSVDHPYDKASVGFHITAPDHYDVVATGRKIEESNLDNGYKLTVYREPAPVATKVVTIGVTKFASRHLGDVHGIPVSAWVYPENRLDGFTDYDVATAVLGYFITAIGPYSYSKLANMQAKTQWGGLENAGTIAYFENSVTGKKTVEGLIAHEVAHQWFGNSVTENDWNHVWLSEGFATYFAILYLEHVYGDEKRQEELILDRQQIIAYFKKNPAPIIDPTIRDPMKVLSTNSYQKAGWVLHMLRKKLGDELFWKGIKAYYAKYRNKNAMTADFRHTMEEVSGTKLNTYFEQWLFTEGHPVLQWQWEYKKGEIHLKIEQSQRHHTFSFPLEIGIMDEENNMVFHTVHMDKKAQAFIIAHPKRPQGLVLDPRTHLLFEQSATE